MPLTMTERRAGAAVILELAGELKFGAEADELRARLKKLLEARPPRVVLKLAGLARIDSIGIGTVMDAVQRAQRAGGDVVLLEPSPKVREVLGFLQLANRPELLRIFADEPAALEVFAAAASRP